jgi:SulP family sulfate permease
VERPHPHTELLRQEGKALIILELQGYIFFGTANNIHTQLKERLKSDREDPPRVVMLDFRRVSGIDASAALSFTRLKRLLSQYRIVLVFTQLSPEVETQLRRDVLTAGDQDYWRVFPDLDHGLEWFEQLVLQSEAAERMAVVAQPGVIQVGQDQGGIALLFAALGAEGVGSDEDVDQSLMRLMRYLERVEVDADCPLIQQGERHEHLYFLDSGELVVEYYTDEDKSVRLAASGPGTIVGELSFYLGTPASATVTAARPSILYSLSSTSLQRMEQEDPLASVLLHRFLLKRVGSRLLGALETIEELAD